jgi:CBS domain-containing protein
MQKYPQTTVVDRGEVMQVHEVMTEPPQTCPQTMHLPDASRRMGTTGCGSLIVLGPRGRIVGFVTDRDLALALSDPRDARRLTVDAVMSRHVHSCRSDDELFLALDRMARFRVRRLPVIDEDGDVKGLVSIDDIVLWGLQSPGVNQRLIAALRSLCATSTVAAKDYAERSGPV